jgi:hypothetical protein
MLMLPFRDKRMFIQFQSAASHSYTFVSLSAHVLNYSGTSVIRTDSQYGGEDRYHQKYKFYIIILFPCIKT